MAESELIRNEPLVRLTLSMDEALTLLDLTGNVAGSLTTSYRRDTESVFEALKIAAEEADPSFTFYESECRFGPVAINAKSLPLLADGDA